MKRQTSLLPLVPTTLINLCEKTVGSWTPCFVVHLEEQPAKQKWKGKWMPWSWGKLKFLQSKTHKPEGEKEHIPSCGRHLLIEHLLCEQVTICTCSWNYSISLSPYVILIFFFQRRKLKHSRVKSLLKVTHQWQRWERCCDSLSARVHVGLSQQTCTWMLLLPLTSYVTWERSFTSLNRIKMVSIPAM